MDVKVKFVAKEKNEIIRKFLIIFSFSCMIDELKQNSIYLNSLLALTIVFSTSSSLYRHRIAFSSDCMYLLASHNSAGFSSISFSPLHNIYRVVVSLERATSTPLMNMVNEENYTQFYFVNFMLNKSFSISSMFVVSNSTRPSFHSRLIILWWRKKNLKYKNEMKPSLNDDDEI